MKTLKAQTAYEAQPKYSGKDEEPTWDQSKFRFIGSITLVFTLIDSDGLQKDIISYLLFEIVSQMCWGIKAFFVSREGMSLFHFLLNVLTFFNSTAVK